jgi:hypothetical protein
LLLQRCETAEDLLAFDRAWANGNDSAGVGDDDDFVLKAPPRPVRLRDSTGGSTLASLNMSAATTPTVMGGGTIVGHSHVPSLFSLSHPLGDILPVSTFVEGDLQAGPVTDVFEKILFVGVMKWVDEVVSSFMDRKEYSQPICVTYHNQLKRWVLATVCLLVFLSYPSV